MQITAGTKIKESKNAIAYSVIVLDHKVLINRGSLIWIPKSQCTFHGNIPLPEIPDWLAKELIEKYGLNK